MVPLLLRVFSHRHMMLKIMLIIIMMHPIPVYRTVLAFVGWVLSVGGSPHRRLFFHLVNYFIVLISLLHLEPKETNIHCRPRFLKLQVCIPCAARPCVVSAQWLICPPAKKKTPGSSENTLHGLLLCCSQ